MTFRLVCAGPEPRGFGHGHLRVPSGVGEGRGAHGAHLLRRRHAVRAVGPDAGHGLLLQATGNAQRDNRRPLGLTLGLPLKQVDAPPAAAKVQVELMLPWHAIDFFLLPAASWKLEGASAGPCVLPVKVSSCSWMVGSLKSRSEL